MIDYDGLVKELWQDAHHPIGTQQHVSRISGEAATAIETLRAEVDALQQELVDSAPSPYCEVCGSCGDDGCGCTHKCKYAFEHPEVAKAIGDNRDEVDALNQIIRAFNNGMPAMTSKETANENISLRAELAATKARLDEAREGLEFYSVPPTDQFEGNRAYKTLAKQEPSQ